MSTFLQFGSDQVVHVGEVTVSWQMYDYEMQKRQVLEEIEIARRWDEAFTRWRSDPGYGDEE